MSLMQTTLCYYHLLCGINNLGAVVVWRRALKDPSVNLTAITGYDVLTFSSGSVLFFHLNHKLSPFRNTSKAQIGLINSINAFGCSRQQRESSAITPNSSACVLIQVFFAG